MSKRIVRTQARFYLWTILICLTLSVVSVTAFARDEHDVTSRPDDLAGRVEGQAIMVSEIDQQIATALRPLRTREYELRRRALDDMIDRKVLESEAQRRHLSVDALLRTEVEARVAVITDQDVQAMLATEAARFKGLDAEGAHRAAEAALRADRTDVRRREFLGELRRRSKVEVYLKSPRTLIPIGNQPSLGDPKAPVTIAEFADFQCPYCARVESSVKKLLESYGQKVRLVFFNFPLKMHAFAFRASEASLCAQEQGKFWEMHDRLFANQRELGIDDLKRHARAINLDGEKFDQCLDSGRQAAALRRDSEVGQTSGVTGTPAFFINGRFVSGAQPYEAFRQVLDEELGAAVATKASSPPQ